MQEAVPVGQGGMAAILGLGDDKINRLCAKATENARLKRSGRPDMRVETTVEPANFNAQGQTVIAGSFDAIEEAITLIKTDAAYADGKAIPLQVSAPFHCSLMKPAAERMSDLFNSGGTKPAVPAYPYIPNRTARLTKEPGVVFELLVEQVDHPVLWRQSLLAAIDGGMSVAIEFGPGKVLQGLAKRAGQTAGKAFQLGGVSDATTLKATESLLRGA
jgi:[acyl-carrier-protein] S-malonyltransferase